MAALVQQIRDALYRAHRFATRDIWQIGTPGEELPQGIVIKQIRVAILLGSKLLDGQHMVRAAALTFVTLLSIVPLLAVTFFLISRLHLDTEIYDLISSRIERVADYVAGDSDAQAVAGEPSPESPEAAAPTEAATTEVEPVETTVVESAPTDDVTDTGEQAPDESADVTIDPEEDITAEERSDLQSEMIETFFRGVTREREGMVDPVEGISSTAEKLATLANDAASNSAALTVSGILLVLTTVFGLMRNIENTFNRIWGVRRRRSWYRTFADYFIIMLLIPFVVAAAMGVLTALQSDAVSRAMGPFRFVLGLSQFTLVVLVFSALYRFVPNTKVKFQYALLAGIIAGTLWTLLSWGYVQFQFGLARYALILSAFAQFPMLLMWVYLSWAIVLLGCEVTYAYQHERTFALERYAAGASFAYREAVGMRAMVEIGHRFAEGGPGFNAETASQEWNVPLRLLNDELDSLVKAGLLAVRATDPEEYLPARPLDRIDAAEIIKALRSDGTEPSRFLEDPQFRKLFAGLARADQNFAGATLADLVAGHAAALAEQPAARSSINA